MKEETHDINEIIIRYLDGSAELEEKRLLLRWLKQSDDNRDDFIATRDLWLSCNVAAGNELEIDIALGKLKNRILLEQGRMERNLPAKRNTLSVVLRWTRIAAVLLLLLGIGYGIGSWKEHSAPDVIVQNQLITAKGSKGRFTLPDGSVVWLNSETKLTYPNQFADDRRLVSLEGEAYFEVAKDANRPFIVHTDHFATRVLGTSFDVTTAPRADGSSAVVLVEGSVAIDVANGESVTLNPSERFSMKDGSYSVYEVDPYKYISWKDGLLFFTSNTLFEVLQKVAAFYKIEITCSGEIGSRKCTGKLILFDDLDGTLDVLSDIFRIAYVRGPDGSVAVRPAPDDCADAVYR